MGKSCKATSSRKYGVTYAEAQQPVATVQPIQAIVVTQQLAVAAPQQAVEPIAASQKPVPTPKPWIVLNWKGVAIGGGILLILAILAQPVLRRVERVQVEREEQCRFAREHLKKVFDRIFVEGERPAGKNTPEGEIVPFGNGRDAVGGGRWFVIGPSYIWAVQGNGTDNDNWVQNNVETEGPGAIGARVIAEEDIVKSIKTLAEAGS